MSRNASLVAGVDGCPDGWVAVVGVADFGTASGDAADGTAAAVITADGGRPWMVVASTLQELAERYPSVRRWAIDIPIGLMPNGPRECDQLARRQLSPQRGSSVFPAPCLAALQGSSYAEACQLSAAATGKKISKQTWNIMPKIREIRTLFTDNPRMASRFFETHPELCFARLAGQPLTEAKKTVAGKLSRQKLLADIFHRKTVEALVDQATMTRGVGVDDLLDAMACWTAAQRDLLGQSLAVPSKPQRDALGCELSIRW